MRYWHYKEIGDTVKELQSHETAGLSATEALTRLERYGPNTLIERSGRTPWHIIKEQLTATMVLILIIAAVISAFMGDFKDTTVILAIVVLNLLLGFHQEYRAERAMSALRRLTVPSVRVSRDGQLQEMSADTLVPGDILQLESGNLVPADGRLLECVNLRVQEAALTGEAEGVDKSPETLTQADIPVADRRNMVFMGTLVTSGRARVIVTDTGMATELGSIARMLQTMAAAPTPLQQRLDKLGRTLAGVALLLVAVILLLGLLRGEPAKLMFMTAISIAVAAVPEGLPAVVTIALALGAQRMLTRHALIRKLSAVETLGSVTVICTDKTGTLTENRMTVAVLDVAGHRINMREPLQSLPATEPSEGVNSLLRRYSSLSLILTGAALCNDASLIAETTDTSDSETAHGIGDPTETALLVAAARLGLDKHALESILPRETEIPFDSGRKRMTTVHRVAWTVPHAEDNLHTILHEIEKLNHPSLLAFTKGAVDRLLELSDQVWVGQHQEPMTAGWRERILHSHDQLAGKGMRVLGVTMRSLPATETSPSLDNLEQNLIFVGLVGLIDPPRAEVRQAVATCKTAGIRPVMITGDHPLTAQSIALELGILETDGRITTGQELDRMDTEEFDRSVQDTAVYARVSPEHKLLIVEALQRQGHIVAMTGDGVNDAPALKRADIGVAMGVTGTDVSKEAADMVLLNDNFATVVAAVEEGRVIYDNIRKFVKYIVMSNAGEIWVMLLAPFLGMPLPLLSLQILWINLVTDGLPSLALGVEPAERDIMRRPPRDPRASLITPQMGWQIFWVSLLMGVVSLSLGFGCWQTGKTEWQTMLFTTLTLSQLGNVLALRSSRYSLFQIGLRSNRLLLGAVVLTVLLQLSVIYIPFLQQTFSTVALSGADLLLSFALSTIVFWAIEAVKWYSRRNNLSLRGYPTSKPAL